MPPRVHAAEFVLHTWLFPRASCVVHHGGPGTAAAAFRAGIPSIFVPHTFDQPIWADLAHDLGTVAPIPLLELTAERLASAITTTLNEERYREVAARLREKILTEQGVRTAAELIEDLVYKIGLHDKAESAAGEMGAVRGGAELPKGGRRRLYQQQQRLRREGKS
jgi:sterol 3beta-glucosyltransferase